MSFGTENLLRAALLRINQNPQLMQEIQNNPMKRSIYEALKNGDANRGQELARNLCSSCGESPDSMISKAMGFFNSR